MTKQDFLTELQRALSGKISSAEIQSHVRYYDDYISMEMRKGREEEAVLEELGDARLLAKTIAATSAGTKESSETEQETERSRGSVVQIPGWVAILIVLLLLGVFLYAAGVLVAWLLPIAVPIAVVYLVIRYLRRR